MKLMIILRGLPGSGKTTLAKLLEQIGSCPEGFLVESFAADDYFTQEDGTYNFDATKLGAAHASCFNKTEASMRCSTEIVIVHNTFTQEKEIAPYKELADRFNYQFVSLIVENRHGNGNVHGVPEEALERMKNRFSVKL